jgi:hypothetical protein
VPWIAPVCLVLVFLLSLFPWVGIFYGGTAVVTQNAWGAAFGAYSEDEQLADKSGWANLPADQKPGPDVLMIFFLLLGLLPAVPLAVAAAALPWLKRRYPLPPQATLLEPWRWLIVTGMTLVALLFLFLQVVTSFSIESRTREAIGREVATQRSAVKAAEARWIDLQAARAVEASGLHRTSSVRLSFLLLVAAAAGAALAHWMEHRGAAAPPPRLELLW